MIQPAVPAVPVLMYHEIADRRDSASRLAVSPSDWAEQLACLHDEGFRTVTAAEVVAALHGTFELPPRAVSITFDDGYADFHGQALPLLAQYGFSATVFVTTGWVPGGEPMAGCTAPGQMMSWTQLAEAIDSGIEIASHSHLHPQLDRLPQARVLEELRISKQQLEDRLGRPVTGLAYPFGYFNPAVKDAARSTGYAYACAVQNSLMGDTPDLFAIPRLTVRRSTGIDAFAKMARGENVRGILFADRALSRGWAAVRRSQAAARILSRV